MSAGAGGRGAEEGASATPTARSWDRVRDWLGLVGSVVGVLALVLGVVNACRQADDRARMDTAEVHRFVAQAEEHLERGELEEARHDLGAAQIHDRGSDGVAVIEGRCLAMGGDLAGGIEVLRQAVLRRPDSVLAHFHLGRLLAQSGDTDGARQHLDRALAAADRGTTEIGRAVIMVNLGDVLLVEGDRDGAKAVYQQALSADASSSDAHARMGEIYMAEARYREAYQEFSQAASTDPGNAEHLLGSANAAYYAGSYAPAEELARRALQVRETKEAFHILALALEEQGKDSREVRRRLDQFQSRPVRWDPPRAEPVTGTNAAEGGAG